MVEKGSRDDVVEKGSRDDVVEKGSRDDVVEKGSRDDVVEKGSRDDVVERGSSLCGKHDGEAEGQRDVRRDAHRVCIGQWRPECAIYLVGSMDA